MSIDIRAALNRVAPGAEYGWRGGAWDDYSQVEWRDQVIPQPSLAELQAAWSEIEAEGQQANQTLVNIKNTAQSAAGVALADLTQAQIKSLLAILLWQAGGVDKDGLVRPLGEWVK